MSETTKDSHQNLENNSIYYIENNSIYNNNQ